MRAERDGVTQRTKEKERWSDTERSREGREGSQCMR